MKGWVSTILASAFTAVLAATAADAGPCARDSSRNCLDLPATVNFSSVPEISNQIVGEEKIKPTPLKNPAEGETSTPYTGPIIGTNPRPGRTPTVGYHWSLE
jgi:hypothetical protein